MTEKEAIARIKDHKIAHKMNEPEAIYISEALDMAIDALEENQWQKGYDAAMENANKTKESLVKTYEKWIELCQVQQKLIDDLMSKNEKMRKALEELR